MNKNKRIVIICGLLICLTAIGGFLYGKEQRRQQIKDLPVIENMATYPAYTLAQLTDEATYIVEATVSRVKDSKMEKVDAYYIDESGKKVDWYHVYIFTWDFPGDFCGMLFYSPRYFRVA